MKPLRTLSLLLAVGFALPLFSQSHLSGKTTYITKSPGSIGDTARLYFDDTSSTYYLPQRFLPWDEIERNVYNDPRIVHKQQVLESMKKAMEESKFNTFYHRMGSGVLLRPWRAPDEKQFCIVDSLPGFDWQLTEDTTRILGYLCQKAKCRSVAMDGVPRDFTAWFTSEIPIAYGPFRFYGLPGLILAVESPYYSFQAVELQLPIPPAERKSINNFQGVPRISREQSNQISQKQVSDKMNMFRLQGL